MNHCNSCNKIVQKKASNIFECHKNVCFFFHRKTVGKGHKHLGLQLASDLKWANHVNFIVNKAYKKLGLLKKPQI